MHKVHEFAHRQHEFTAQPGKHPPIGQVNRPLHDLPVTMGKRQGFIGLPQLPQQAADMLGAAGRVLNPSQSLRQIQVAAFQPLECVTIEATTPLGTVGINSAKTAVKTGAGLGERRTPAHPTQHKPRGLKR